VLGPDGFDLIVGCEIAMLGPRERRLKGRFLVGAQPYDGLIVAGQLQEDAGKGVLRFRREFADSSDGWVWGVE
jgi:hypothetical protein